MTRKPITIVHDVDEAGMNYDETDADKIGAAITDAVRRYVEAGGELDTFAIDVEPIELDSMTGIRITLSGYDRDSDWGPGGS